jgi:hypothetical protein
LRFLRSACTVALVADTLTLTASLSTVPAIGSASGRGSIIIPIEDRRSITGKLGPAEYRLTSDSPQAVGFGTLTNASIIVMRVVSGGAVRARFTSDFGNTQSLPVDPTLLLECRREPCTAIDLTREAGVETVVEVTLAAQT